MVQNNKSKNTSTGGGIDITSWIIAIIATLLIIGGVYLLVISLNPSTKPTTIVKTTSTSSQVQTSAALSSVATSVAATSSVASEASSVVATSSVASAVSSVAVSSVAPVVAGPAPLKTGQTSAEVIGQVGAVEAGLIKITVVESGFTNTRWLRVGVFTNILASYIPNAQVGDKYRIQFDINSSQSDGSFVINDLKVVDKVK
jgi:cytoskeletal protein RodZ